jgi:serine/threonine protein kinase/formylglycine-generating enzyme required for sulfatase activity
MAGDSPSTEHGDESWERRLDRVCDLFETAWQKGERPRIEEFVSDLREPERTELLSSLLEVEIEFRSRTGESPTLGEYLGRFPHDAAVVKAAFAGADDLPSEWIDRFRVMRRLGGGGFGDVYLCYDDKLRRHVAIKVPRPDRFVSSQTKEFFLAEARNVAALRHGSIATLHDFGESEGQCYLVYEYIAGVNLAERLQKGAIPQGQIAAITAQVADALDYAHGENVYHRDIKPANILLDRHEQPYLIDFGLAVHVQNLAAEGGRLAGTRAYMAPEVLRGEGHLIDGRSDIYSLGVVLYEMLAGQRPFEGSQFKGQPGQSARIPRPIREINREVHPELEEICLKALAESRSDRHVTAGDMAEKLRKVAAILAESKSAGMTTKSAVEVATPSGPPSTPPPPAPVLPKGLRSFGPEDKAFFLELLPGPRDRNRLPESIRFWKSRIESTDPRNAFSVGLVYGPSGCGKSSLIKAGLLPQLAPSVLPVYLEAAHADTEDRLLAQLRTTCVGLGRRLSLPTALSRLRRSRILPPGSKLLIVLDQFEQWLHAHAHDMEDTELAAALKQVDGQHVQVLLLVRSDFWMSISRLFESLKINLDRSHNARGVDLFGEGHSRHVLRLFGTAYGQLPADGTDLTDEQNAFLALAVKELGTDGDVIPVRLSLFAEMMKNRPWTKEEFDRVGGTKGLGRKFLEDIFTQPHLRARKDAAQAMLQTLLPSSGADIKGPMRSSQELAAAAGLPEDSPAFVQLIENLSREYILTPADPSLSTASDSRLPNQPLPASGSAGSPLASDRLPSPISRLPSYQLTHDYLVPSLREWLTEERKKTWSGRAQLRLAERTASWTAQPQNRFLPASWEFADILLLTRRREWTQPQKKMMRSAGWYHGLRGCALVLVITCIGWAAYEGNGRIRAHTKVTELVSAAISEVPERIKELAPYRRWAQPQLLEFTRDKNNDPRKRRNAHLALLSSDSADVDFLMKRLLKGDPDEVRVLGKMLLERQGPSMAESLWQTVESPNAGADRRLRAASALAAHDPGDPRWDKVSRALVDKLLTEFLAGWGKELELIGEHLVPPLIDVLNEPKRSETERSVAANYLADFARNLPDTLAELVKSADTGHVAILLPPLLKHKAEAVASMNVELERKLGPDWKDQTLDAAWTKPSQAIVDKIEAAHGILADRFAFCQTMPLDDFLAMGDALRTSGYRPICFRPYTAADKVQVAAIWTRDGKDWHLAYDLSAAELRSQDSRQRQKGLLPVDVALYGSGESERYAALWGTQDREITDAKLDLELPNEAFASTNTPPNKPNLSDTMQKAGFIPRTQVLSHSGKQPRHTIIWCKPRSPADNPFFDVGKDQSWYESNLTPSELLTDVRVDARRETGDGSKFRARGEGKPPDVGRRAVSANSPIQENILNSQEPATLLSTPDSGLPSPVSYSAIWHSSADWKSAESHNLDPVRHLERCRQLAKDEYRPVSISVFSMEPSGSLRSTLAAASVWHRPVVPDAAKDALAKRQARAAVALLRLDQPERAWSLLPFRPDPTKRTYVIHSLRPFGVYAQVLVERLQDEREVSARRAILQALGEYPVGSLADSSREGLFAELQQMFHDNPDPGIHSSAEWLLRRWGQDDWLTQTEKKLISQESHSGRQWYVNGEGQTMMVIQGPVEFWMGSPGSEPGRVPQEEAMRHVQISYSYAIASKEVTTEQFRRFLDANPRIRDRYSRNYGSNQEPVGNVTWVEAVEYCRWLSKKERIPPEQMCYPRLEEIRPNMELGQDILARTGYRLPTEREWEYACRAGSVTSRSFGESDEMCPNYAWFARSWDFKHTWPVGQLKPNEFGLFDMYGNVGEWCQHRIPLSQSGLSRAIRFTDKEEIGRGWDNPECGWRGGSFGSWTARLRSAATSEVTWATRQPSLGLRIARTQR